MTLKSKGIVTSWTLARSTVGQGVRRRTWTSVREDHRRPVVSLDKLRCGAEDRLGQGPAPGECRDARPSVWARAGMDLSAAAGIPDDRVLAVLRRRSAIAIGLLLVCAVADFVAIAA